jgi:OOP family OmpA-OmpF porin
MKRVLGIVLCSLPSLVFAQGYVGAGFGQTSVAVSDCGVPGVSCNTDDKSTGFKLFGGYEFGRHFSVEGGYINFGQFTQTANGFISGTQVTARGVVDVTGFFADAILAAPVSSSVSIFGRLGLTAWNVSAKAQASGGGRSASASDSSTGISPNLGIGVKIAVTQKISLRGELQRFARIGNDSTTGQSDIDMVSASVLYRF